MAPILLSLVVAAVATAIDVALGLPVAYGLARGRLPGRRAVEAVLMAPLVLPPTVTGFLLLVVLGPRGLLGQPIRLLTGWSVPFSPAAAVIASAVVAFPLFLRAARGALEAVPEAQLQNARALGLGRWRRAVRVALPLASRGLWAGTALAFGRAFGEFGATLMLAGDIPGRTQTLALAVFDAAAAGDDSRAGWLCAGMAALALGLLWIATSLEGSSGRRSQRAALGFREGRPW